MKVPQEIVDAVLDRSDIVQVFTDRQVALKRVGKEMMARCPFHEERTASLSVNVATKTYYCFGCGAGGGLIKFVQEFDKSNFEAAVRSLAAKCGVTVPDPDPVREAAAAKRRSEQEVILEVLAAAAQWYSERLAGPALDYLRSRLSDEAIARWGLGYAPTTGLLDRLSTYPRWAVERSGLLTEPDDQGRQRERMRDRVIIPIHDAAGRIVGFGGRALGDHQPKYLNSPETELFDKGKLLFGFDRAKRAIAQADTAIVVEGYFDVIALHEAGITNAVAAMGTALSADQINTLARLTESKRIVLNFDTDKAGFKAADRSIAAVEELVSRGQIQLRVLSLEGGKDADEFLKQHGADRYRELASEAPLWGDWQIAQAIAERDLSKGEEWQQAIAAALVVLRKIQAPALLTGYLHRTAERLARGNPNLTLQIEADLRSQLQGPRTRRRAIQVEQSAGVFLEQQLLWLYAHRPALRPEIDRLYPEFTLPQHRNLWRLLRSGERAELGFDVVADAAAIAQFAGLQRQRQRSAAMTAWAQSWATATEGCPKLQALTDITLETLIVR